MVFSVFLLLNGCKNKTAFNSESLQRANNDYSRFKNKFDESLISHFPKNITHIENFVSYNTDIKRNNVGLYLVERNLLDKEIINLEKQLADSNFRAKYTSQDSCLLKVNRFETFESIENNKPVEIDTTLVNKVCYKNRLPVPSFMDYSIENKTIFWKKENFVTYVIEAKSGNYFNEFDLQPDEQMPKEWKNGYSKGISINREKRTVIYWSIIW
jgi:hypothetical protein